MDEHKIRAVLKKLKDAISNAETALKQPHHDCNVIASALELDIKKQWSALDLQRTVDKIESEQEGDVI